MDPVSLTLGILPLVGGAIGVYKLVRSKLKTFCHYSREVSRIQKQFGRQRQFFVNEIQLVLRLALEDESLADVMTRDASHAKWMCQALEREMNRRMGDSTESFQEIIQDITTTMGELDESLRCFEPLKESRDEDEILKDAVKRLKGRLKITFDKAKFEQLISRLRNANDDLKRLREQTTALESSKTCSKAAIRRTRPVLLSREFKSFGSIRRASKALHEALALVWSKADAPHPHHSVKLFVDARADEEVRMEIVILCHGHDLIQRRMTQASLLRLQVRSQTLISLLQAGLLTPSPSASSEVSGNGNVEDVPQKRRKVRFQDDSPPSKGALAVTDEVASLGPSELHDCPSVDLRSSAHICRELARCSGKTPKELKEHCLGYIDTGSRDGFRHSFYPWSAVACSTTSSPCHVGIQPTEAVPMDELLGHKIDNSLSIVEQLKLAHRLVSAVLKFHSTPWLNECFQLRELSFFRQGEDLSASLETLHVDLEFAKQPPLRHGGSAGAAMEGVETAHAGAGLDAEDYALLHGIRSPMLHSLGVALLQIGHWSHFDAGDILAVRRSASQVSRLGPRYSGLTQKVLNCDFSYGSDLSKPQLQRAIYENVVCELSAMIAALDLSSD